MACTRMARAPCRHVVGYLAGSKSHLPAQQSDGDLRPMLRPGQFEGYPRWRERLRWWGIASAALGLTPLVHIRWGVRTGRLSDHEISATRVDTVGGGSNLSSRPG
jgi:hypothetical protein